MDRKWNEKTTVEKIADIISWIALGIWVVFEILQRMGKVNCAEAASCIAFFIVCICQAVSYWNVKRVFSYIAIAGAICIATAVGLIFLLVG